MTRLMGTLSAAKGQAGRLGTRTIIPPCTTGTAVLVSRLSLGHIMGLSLPSSLLTSNA